MFENIGGKIKTVASVCSAVGILFSIIIALISLSFLGIVAILIGGLGCLLSWVGSFVLYGFGQLIENSDLLVKQTQSEKQTQSDNTPYTQKINFQSSDLSPNLYAENGAIGIISGKMTHAPESNDKIATLCIKNVSSKMIISASVSIGGYDHLHQKSEMATQYTYRSLSVAPNENFGQDMPIPLSDKSITKIYIRSITVEFADHTKWSCTEEELQPLPIPTSLHYKLSNANIKKYMGVTTRKAAFIPQLHMDGWICTCGSMNKYHTCSYCNCTKTDVFSAYHELL